tara:strand:+ start:1169 stop:1345 length:177 start_codon:yes stop_codon:yes gene_type:complete
MMAFVIQVTAAANFTKNVSFNILAAAKMRDFATLLIHRIHKYILTCEHQYLPTQTSYQ